MELATANSIEVAITFQSVSENSPRSSAIEATTAATHRAAMRMRTTARPMDMPWTMGQSSAPAAPACTRRSERPRELELVADRDAGVAGGGDPRLARAHRVDRAPVERDQREAVALVEAQGRE